MYLYLLVSANTLGVFCQRNGKRQKRHPIEISDGKVRESTGQAVTGAWKRTNRDKLFEELG